MICADRYVWHYSGVTCASKPLKSPAIQLFFHRFMQSYIKENAKAPHLLPYARWNHGARC